MYAYIDETGNTGSNLFDPAQPVFITAALITKTNFDLIYKRSVAALSGKLGASSLHANHLGPDKLEEIADNLLRLLKKADARFMISRIVKMDLAAFKLFDSIFDSGENRAVSWMTYNIRPLRMSLVMKVAYLLDDQLLTSFWDALMMPDEARGKEVFLGVLHELLRRVHVLPDKRSREVISQALQWAIDNPQAIHLHINTKIHRYGHLPNIAAFPEVLKAVEILSQKWNRPVIEVFHDRQSQFGPTLKTWHEITSNTSVKTYKLIGDEEIMIQKVAGSRFTLTSSDENAGIQIIDVILWLFKQVHDGKPLPKNCARLINHALGKSMYYEISMDNLQNYLTDVFDKLESVPLTDNQVKNAYALLSKAEETRQAAMREYQQTLINAE